MRPRQPQRSVNKRTLVSNRYKTQYSKQQPDLYIILLHKIYPLHLKFLKQSKYITDKLVEGEKVIIVGFQFNLSKFQQTVQFLYTSQFTFERDQTIIDVIEIAKQLQIRKLQQFILQDFKNNFDQYSIFLLYKISHIYNYEAIKKKCLEELMALQYHQININRSSLYELNKNMFEQIIKIHQKLKANKSIVGLSTQQIVQVVEQYCEYSNLQIDLQQLIQIKHQCFEIESTRLKTPKVKKMMTLSSGNKNSQSSSEGKNNFKSMILTKKSFKNTDKIKQMLLEEIEKGNTNIKKLIDSLNNSLQPEINSQQNELQFSPLKPKSNCLDVSQSKANYKKQSTSSFKHLSSSEQISQKDLSEFQFSSKINLESKNTNDKTTKQKESKNQSSILDSCSQSLKIPQIQKLVNF